MAKTLRVLNIEDSQRDASLLERNLTQAGFEVIFERQETAAGMKAALETKEWDVILADYTLPQFSALEALSLLKQTGLDIPLIVISGTIGEELAVEAMHAGAADYIMKGKLARLSVAIERELEEARNRRSMQKAEEEAARLTAAIQEQRDRLNAIVASVPGVVFEAWGRPDLATQRTDFVSDYIQIMLGYSVQEWLSTPNFWLLLVHPEDRDRVGREAAEHFAAKRNGSQTFRWIAKDGGVLWVEANYIVVADESGQPIGLRGVTIDITERRNAEERYRQLFESNPDPIFVFNQDNLHFVAVNEAAVHEYGYSRDEFLALPATALKPANEVAVFLKHLSDLPYGPPQGTTWKHRRKDGTIIDVEITRRPLNFTGKPAWVMLARNITDRKILEEQFRQAQKMEAVGQLAGGVAHDFNNLLTVINGYSELALDRLKAEDPLRHDLEQILRAGDRAAALTRQLLAFSRKQVLLPTALNLSTVIVQLEKMLQRLIGEDVSLFTDLEPEAGTVKADRGQIEQVVMNLVVNARDAMPAGGKLTIETRNLDLTEDYTRQHAGIDPGPHVMLAVSDNGTGMDTQTLARIFEPFFTTKEAGKGTGLGLSTVYGIVRQFGGSIWVYSEIGHGTTFKIYFPIVAEPHQHQESATPATAARGKETILLTEDDDMVRALASRVLSRYGYQVLEAANGAAALAVCEQHSQPIHLLVTDVVMPGMSGSELADRSGKIHPGMKVLFMSGYTDRAVIHQQILDEKTPFIQKPFASDALARKVREVLDQAR